MRIGDWSSDVCSSDLRHHRALFVGREARAAFPQREQPEREHIGIGPGAGAAVWRPVCESLELREKQRPLVPEIVADPPHVRVARDVIGGRRSEEHTSELQSYMRN